MSETDSATETQANPRGRRRPSSARLERVLSRTTLFLIVLVLMAVAAEAASYLVWGPVQDWADQQFPGLVTRRPEPYVMFGAGEYLHHEGKVNDLGYRGPRPASEKPLGEYRVVFLGGSTAFYGEPPIAALLENEFRTRGLPQARVYNFGCIAQNSAMELARVVHQAADFQPDLVIHYSGGNDILSPGYADPRPNYPYNFTVYENNPLVPTPASDRRLWLLLAGKSNLVRRLGKNWFEEQVLPLEGLRFQVGITSASWRERIARSYLEALRLSDQVARGAGGESVAFLQPLLCFKTNVLPEEDTLGHMNPFATQHALEVRERIVSAAPAMVERGELRFVDLSDLFKDSTTAVFTDVVHVTQEANQTLAGEIHRRLRAMMKSGQLRSPPAGAFLDRGTARAWRLEAPPGLQASLGERDGDGGLWVNIPSRDSAGAPSSVTLSRPLPPLVGGTGYVIEFRARAVRPASIQTTVVPYSRLARPTGMEKEVDVGTEWSTFRLPFDCPDDQPDLYWEFQLGAARGPVELADFRLSFPKDWTPPPLTPEAMSSARPRTPLEARSAENRGRVCFVHGDPKPSLRFPDGADGRMRLELGNGREGSIERRLGFIEQGARRELFVGLRSAGEGTVTLRVARSSDLKSDAGFDKSVALTNQWLVVPVSFAANASDQHQLHFFFRSPVGASLEIVEGRSGAGEAIALGDPSQGAQSDRRADGR